MGEFGLFDWSQEARDGIKDVMQNLQNPRQKRRRAVCYLMELAGDLLLDRTANVSQSPGMEQLIRVYGGHEE